MSTFPLSTTSSSWFGLDAVEGQIDLAAIAQGARDARDSCDATLQEAARFTDKNAILRWWKFDELQQHLIDAIGNIRTVSEANIALAAICNDLATTSLDGGTRALRTALDGHIADLERRLDEVRSNLTAALNQVRAELQESAREGRSQTRQELEDAVGIVRHECGSELSQLADRVSAQADEHREAFGAARKLVDAHIDSMTTHLSEAERRLAAENQRTATQAVYALAEAEHRISSKVGAVVKATRKELRRVSMASRRELLAALVCLLLIQMGTIAFLVLR